MGELFLSVALPPSARISEYAHAAEDAGCARLWLFDSPAGSAALGVTEIVYTPAGPDIVGEITAFAAAFDGTGGIR
jgi:hypothetical protein